ncbi:hypothetical protein Areg01_44620 [Actinoplanes regularis]|nr:hypothetical protein Areg01_44620 [Actinoplanes regularis]
MSATRIGPVKLADVLQVISLIAVAVALFLNYRQARETARQAREAARQVELSTAALRQDSYRQLVTHGTSANQTLLAGNPGLLGWFLASRGVPTGTHEENLRHMFVFWRMDSHEEIFRSHAAGQLPGDAWQAWRNVIEADAALPEFGTVWSRVRPQYTRDFADFVDTLLPRRDAPAE